MIAPGDRSVDETADGTGAKDAVAPVQGAHLEDVDIGAVMDRMSPQAQEKAAKRLIDAQPALRKARRDRVRAALAILLLIFVFADAGAALGLAMAEAITWDQMKDWLTLALVPLTPGVAVALAFWFPVKESD